MPGMGKALEILNPIVLGLAFLWLALVVWLSYRLRTRHASTYERLPSPRLLMLFWFVFSSQWKELNDPELGSTVRVMRIEFVCFIALWVAWIVIGETTQ
jgi:hypothetical protein